MEILTRRRITEIQSLSKSKFRKKLGEFLLEGVRSVEAAHAAGVQLTTQIVNKSSASNDRVNALMDLMPTSVLSDIEFKKLSVVDHTQGVLAVATLPENDPMTLWDCNRVLYLDGVQDPGNVGTLIRTAAWFGVDAIVSDQQTADFFSPKVVRSTMGGLWDVKLFRLADTDSFLQKASKRDYAIYGAEMSGVALKDWRPAEKSVLVMGSEAHGVSENAKDVLTEAVCIQANFKTTNPGTESLNVAVAGGILMQNWVR